MLPGPAPEPRSPLPSGSPPARRPRPGRRASRQTPAAAAPPAPPGAPCPPGCARIRTSCPSSARGGPLLGAPAPGPPPPHPAAARSQTAAPPAAQHARLPPLPCFRCRQEPQQRARCHPYQGGARLALLLPAGPDLSSSSSSNDQAGADQQMSTATRGALKWLLPHQHSMHERRDSMLCLIGAQVTDKGRQVQCLVLHPEAVWLTHPDRLQQDRGQGVCNHAVRHPDEAQQAPLLAAPCCCDGVCKVGGRLLLLPLPLHLQQTFRSQRVRWFNLLCGEEPSRKPVLPVLPGADWMEH
jgi:hypothetical protein